MRFQYSEERSTQLRSLRWIKRMKQLNSATRSNTDFLGNKYNL